MTFLRSRLFWIAAAVVVDRARCCRSGSPPICSAF